MQHLSEEYYLIFQHLPVPVLLVSEDDVILDSNPAAFELCRKLNISFQELKGVKLDRLFPNFPPKLQEPGEGDQAFHFRERYFKFRQGVLPLPGGGQGRLLVIDDVTAAKRLERNFEEQSRKLRERIKELNCVYKMSKIMEGPDLQPEEILHKTLDLIVSAWQFPDLITARITVGDQVYQTPHFRQTPRRIYCDIKRGGKKVGRIEVCYLDNPEGYPAVFLQEERVLLEVIAERLSKVLEQRQAREDLIQEKERLAVTLKSIGDGVIAVDTDSRITLINPVAQGLTGWRGREAIHRPLQEVFHIINEYTRQKVTDPVAEVFATGKVVGLANHTVLISRNGSEYAIADSAAPIKDEEGRILGAILVFRDVTGERQLEQELREREALFRFLAENAKDIIFRLRVYPAQKYQYISPAVFSITGYTVEECYDDPGVFHRIVHPEEKELWEQILSGEYDYDHPCIIRLMRKDGSEVWTEQRLVPIYEEGKLVAVEGVARDITKTKKVEEQLRYLSSHDTLTGLFNRYSFNNEILRMEKGGVTRLAIVVCDVDGLKIINDTMGHHNGDKLLREMGQILKRAFPQERVARIGGDEFAVLLPEWDSQQVEGAIREVEERVAYYNKGNQELPLSVSVGYAVTSNRRMSVSGLFKEADHNMYREKLHQRQSVHNNIVRILLKALEARDYITEGHAERLKERVIMLADALGLTSQQKADLALLAQFHDIGKVGIPDRILFKPGRLTVEEKKIMQTHAEIGHRIALSAEEMAPIAQFILHHHEWWNGQGYPLGLAGEEIPIESRILAVVDAYDAMTSDRPYRKAMSPQAAVAELGRCAGEQFDPKIVERFVELLARENTGPQQG